MDRESLAILAFLSVRLGLELGMEGAQKRMAVTARPSYPML